MVIRCCRCKGEADFVIKGFSMCENCFEIYKKTKEKQKEEIVEI